MSALEQVKKMQGRVPVKVRGRNCTSASVSLLKVPILCNLLSQCFLMFLMYLRPGSELFLLLLSSFQKACAKTHNSEWDIAKRSNWSQS